MNNYKELDNKISKQRDIEFFIFGTIVTMLVIECDGLIPSNLPVVSSTLLCIVFYIALCIPSFILCILQKRKLKTLFEGNIKDTLLTVLKLLFFLFIFIMLLALIKGADILGLAPLFTLQEFICQLVCLMFVGFAEEFVFRVYFQETLEYLMGRISFFAPGIVALLFAYGHLVNHGPFQFFVTLIPGLIWGYYKYFSKKNVFPALVISHTLYDLILYIIPVIRYMILK